VRVALGASNRDIVRLIVGRAALLAVAGAIMGCLVAIGATRLIASLLFNVSPTDPLTFGAAIALFVGVSIVASLGPARRAVRADPVETLRGT
jgi:ABC-type antimicrobial peptide transport system permease subunit